MEKFCQDEQLKKEIVNIISENIITLNNEEINSIYENFQNAKDDDNKLNKTSLVYSNQLISSKMGLPIGSKLCGIDFPIWFNDLSKSKKIMLIGIDPLRSEETFIKDYKVDEKSKVIIGTPYALHSKFVRENNTKQYWEFIRLLQEKYFVYISDIFKLYFINEKNIRSYSDKQFKKNPLHIELLKKEIEIIKPDLIITLGKQASQKLNRLLSEINGIAIFPMVHLSNSATIYRDNFIKDSIGIEVKNNNYGECYFQIIENYFANSLK